MASPGRPSKLTAAAQKSIADGVAKGLPLKHAARCAGVGESTLRAWRAAGRAEAAGPYQALEAAIKKADSDAVARNVATVQLAAAERDEVTVKRTVYADGSAETVTTKRRVFEWTAAAWWLERRHPGEFSSDRRELRELRKAYKALEDRVLKLTGGDGATPVLKKPA